MFTFDLPIMLIVIFLVVLATHYAHRYIPGGLGHPLCSSLYTWWSWPPIMLIVIFLVVLATHYAHRYIPGGLGHPLCSSLYTWWSWPPIMLIVIYLVVLATHYAQNYASIINQALTVTCILELSLRTMLSSLGFLISISPCIRYFTGLVYSAQSHCLTGYLQQQGCFISTPDMVTSLMLLLQEKHSKACFDEYYSKAQVECMIKEREIPSPMCMDR